MFYENDCFFQIFILILVYGKSKVRKFQIVIVKKLKEKGMVRREYSVSGINFIMYM